LVDDETVCIEGEAMFPLRDDVPCRSIPFVNYVLIGLCVAVFIQQAQLGPRGDEFAFQYGMVPLRVTEGNRPLVVETEVMTPRGPEAVRLDVGPGPIAPWMTMFTCMFLHGGLMHLVGNMWFLYIFGDNVEDRYGHVGYLLMYVASGLAAGLGHLVSAPQSPIPTVGASGAIAGVMGAYFVMFWNAQVMTLIPLGVFTQLVAIPAPFFLGLWFVFQVISASATSVEGGGVAWWAHVGGFVAGFGATLLLRFGGWLREPGRPHRYAPWHHQRLIDR
jgi:membrane associated rhomboid family serine protease